MPAKLPQALSPGEEQFLIAWRILRGPVFWREFRFHPERGWRFDFAWPAVKIAVEIEGGVSRWKPGRHQRAAGFEEDAIKYLEAFLLGWRVVRLTRAQLQPDLLQRLIEKINEVNIDSRVPG